MRRFITRISLGAWLTVGASLVVAVGLSVVVWRADSMLRTFALERFEQQLRDDSLTLRERIKDLGPVHVEGGKLFAGKAGAAEFQALLEQTVKTINRTGGIFLGRVRVASSAVKPDGTHPIGEAVDNPAILDPVLKLGKETFNFSAVSGAINVVAYQPLQDQSGTVVGMVTAGSPMAFVDAMAQDLRFELLMSAGGIVLLGMALLWGVVHLSLRPLSQQATVLRSLAQGNTDQPVPGLQRTDALGEIARAVVVVQQAVARNRALEIEAELARRETDRTRKQAAAEPGARFEQQISHEVTAVDAAAVTLDAAAGEIARDVDAREAVGHDRELGDVRSREILEHLLDRLHAALEDTRVARAPRPALPVTSSSRPSPPRRALPAPRAEGARSGRSSRGPAR